jgi:hypothetical protein
MNYWSSGRVGVTAAGFTVLLGCILLGFAAARLIELGVRKLLSKRSELNTTAPLRSWPAAG